MDYQIQIIFVLVIVYAIYLLSKVFEILIEAIKNFHNNQLVKKNTKMRNEIFEKNQENLKLKTKIIKLNQNILEYQKHLDQLNKEYLIDLKNQNSQVNYYKIKANKAKRPIINEIVTNEQLNNNSKNNTKDVLLDYYQNFWVKKLEIEEVIFQSSIEQFFFEIERYKTTTLLPYYSLLKIFDLYQNDELINFAKSFELFRKQLEKPHIKRLVVTKYFNAEEKIHFLNQLGAFENCNNNLIEYIYYLLKKYKYREILVIYNSFNKAYNFMYNDNIVKIQVIDQEAKEKIIAIWKEKTNDKLPDVEIVRTLLGGVKIHYNGVVIDNSYKQLTVKYIDEIEGV